MKKKRFKLILIIIYFQLFFILVSDIGLTNDSIQKIHIEKINVYPSVLEEWKQPGRYSPLNAFDSNKKTCYAVQDDSFIFSISFKNRIIFDEIRIAAGLFANDKYYKLNNRVKEIQVKFYRIKKGTDPFRYSENVFYKKLYLLEDKKKYQSIKIDRDYDGKYYYVKFISLYCKNIYKGSKYNDTCVSDIQFFYKGKKIPIGDIEKRKIQYIKEIEKKLFTMFSDIEYELSDKGGYLKMYKNGRVGYNRDIPGKYNKSLVGVTNWKVKNSKLYFKYYGTWSLVQYSYLDNSFFVQKIGKKKFEVYCHPLKR